MTYKIHQDLYKYEEENELSPSSTSPESFKIDGIKEGHWIILSFEAGPSHLNSSVLNKNNTIPLKFHVELIPEMAESIADEIKKCLAHLRNPI